jgi:acetyltransferase-like isoleucine patch superfamily enzyme
MKNTLRNAATCLIMLTPHSIVKNAVLRMLGHNVGKYSKIGINLFLSNKLITLQEHARIGNFNVIRNLNHLQLYEGAQIGNLNWISAAPEFSTQGINAKLILHVKSAITNRHYLDVSGTIELMDGSAIWGVRSTFMTHGIDPTTWQQNASKTTIGRKSVIGSNSVVVPGTTLPDGCYFGMGSLISGVNYQANTKYVNPKATPK